jgi:hypothetical protein
MLLYILGTAAGGGTLRPADGERTTVYAPAPAGWPLA